MLDGRNSFYVLFYTCMFGLLIHYSFTRKIIEYLYHQKGISIQVSRFNTLSSHPTKKICTLLPFVFSTPLLPTSSMFHFIVLVLKSDSFPFSAWYALFCLSRRQLNCAPRKMRILSQCKHHVHAPVMVVLVAVIRMMKLNRLKRKDNGVLLSATK